MLFKFIRSFHSSRVVLASEGSVLAQLRKRTGYTISNCKKALEMHSNDVDKAEKWLHKQAQELGWSKVTKLQGRTTAQGLIALKHDEHHAILVELNCETDFVARNEKFQAMAEEAANACYKFAHSTVQAKGLLTKMCLDNEQLGCLHTPQGKTLAERLALMIGFVGENATLRRAECWKASPGLLLSAYTHPCTAEANTSFATGKFGGIVAYKCNEITEDTPVIARQICQHIVGMNPSKIGNEEFDKPSKDVEEEPCLIYQDFVAENGVTVNEILKDNKIEIVDFVRFECGQSLNSTLEKDGQPLESVQTCQ